VAFKLYLVRRFLPSAAAEKVIATFGRENASKPPAPFPAASDFVGSGASALRPVLLLAALVILFLSACRSAPSLQRSAAIVINGDLSRGQQSPDSWRTDSQEPGAATFEWHRIEGLGELSISSHKPQDSRWVQTIHLNPGWYFFSVNIRTENVPANGVGASLSLLVGGIMSRGSSGTTGWHRVGFYLKVGEPAQVDLACRLGGYSSPNTGSAFFRDIQASRIDKPPPDAAQIYDLDVERGIKAAEPESVGTGYHLAPLVIGTILVLGVGLLLLKFGGPGAIALWNDVVSWMPGASSWLDADSYAEAWMPTPLEFGLVVLGAAIFTYAFSYPVLAKLSFTGVVWDWSEKLSHAWATVNSIEAFHQLPLWDPYSCGGMPLFANPLFSGLTPWFGLDLIFGPIVGVNLQIPIHLAIAWAGGYVLARCLGMSVAGRITCASIFSASSWFFVQVVVGHFEMMATAYLPWIIAFFWESVRRHRMTLCLVAALLVAVAFGEGGIYVCARAAIIIPLLAMFLALTRQDKWPVQVLLVFAVAAAGFSAIKLLPSAQLIRLHPRFIYDPEYNPVSTLLYAIFTRNQYWDHPKPPPGGFYEFGAYLSPIAAVMALIGIAASPRRSTPWLLGAVVLFTLSVGSPRWWFPWALLRHLPVFSSMRIPSISLQTGFVLMVAILSALGGEFLSTRWQRPGIALALILAFAATYDAWVVTMPNARVTVMHQPGPVPANRDFSQFFDGPFNMFATAISNQGSVYCNESLNFSNLPESVQGSNQSGYLGEQYLIGPGSVSLLRWTPNALTFYVDAQGKDRRSRIMVVNQNYDPSWRVNSGSGEVFSEGGLIGVRVPEGRQRLELVYRNYLFYLGALVTFLTGALSLLWWRYERLSATVRC